MRQQHPLVRASTWCVACGEGGKAQGLLVHWECSNNLKKRYDYGFGPKTEAALDALEERLQRGEPQ